MAAQKIGGLVVRVDEAPAFLSAAVVLEVVPMPQVTRVPGAPAELLGIALHGDELLPVIAIGEARESMIVCSCAGEHMGLVGGVIVGSGLFEADESNAVEFRGETCRPLDLASIYAKVHSARWGGRWGG
jgi:CheW-like protein